jgi:hypothetical protein
MSNSEDPIRVVEGSLALALLGQFVRMLSEKQVLSTVDISRVLSATVDGAGSPAAQQAAKRSLRQMFPEVPF